jgi:uncharacterized protein DUF4287
VSFQAYLDSIEKKTGRTPREFIEMARARGYDETTKAGTIVDWLKEDFDLGRGHAMALVHVIKNGPEISEKHVDTDGVHRDESNVLHLDGIAARGVGARDG